MKPQPQSSTQEVLAALVDDANKAKTGAHGWHDYFQFMSKCM
jgi:hypothetical protein